MKIAFTITDKEAKERGWADSLGSDLHLEEDHNVRCDYPDEDYILNWGEESFQTCFLELGIEEFPDTEWQDLKVGDEWSIHARINGQLYKYTEIITSVEVDEEEEDPEMRENEVERKTIIELIKE